MKYKANWIRTNKGNGIKAGNTLIVKVENAVVTTGIISLKWHGLFWKRLQIAQGKTIVSFKLKKKKGKKTVPYDNGHYKLIVRASDKNHKGYGWKDEFEVV